MSMRVTMLQTRRGEAGSMLDAGGTYTVSDALGAYLVGNRFAADVDGSLIPRTAVPGVRGRAVLTQRMLGVSLSGGVTGTIMQMHRAPCEFDAVQVVLRGATAHASNAFKVSVCSPAQRGNGYVALDSVGSQIVPTALTWGTTDRDNFRNPGGGATTTILNNASGSPGTFDVIENDVASDWLPLASANRVDTPGAPPLVLVRIYGSGWPGASWAESQSSSSNPVTQLDPDFYSGYWATADHTAAADPGGAPTQWGMPIVELRYLARGRTGHTIGFAGDSIDQGNVPASAVPQFGANLNGWGRRLVSKLNAAGVLASHLDMTRVGDKSRLFHERAYNAILGRHVTHLFTKPWSVNESGDGVASIPAALQRTTRLIDLAKSKRVGITIVWPWGGQGLETVSGAAALINSYMDNLVAAGVSVFDVRSIMNNAGDQPQPLKDKFRVVNSGGAFIDAIHLNDVACETVANEAFGRRGEFGLL